MRIFNENSDCQICNIEYSSPSLPSNAPNSTYVPLGSKASSLGEDVIVVFLNRSYIILSSWKRDLEKEADVIILFVQWIKSVCVAQSALHSHKISFNTPFSFWQCKESKKVGTFSTTWIRHYTFGRWH